jgi:hypothetical protein
VILGIGKVRFSHGCLSKRNIFISTAVTCVGDIVFHESIDLLSLIYIVICFFGAVVKVGKSFGEFRSTARGENYVSVSGCCSTGTAHFLSINQVSASLY